MRPSEVDEMQLSPPIRDALSALARQLDAAAHGQQTALVQSTADFLGWSKQQVYRHLKQSTAWDSGRKPRSDKGSTSVDSAALTMLGATQREAIRDNGKQTLHTTTARGMLEVNGIELKVSNSQLNRLMRDRKLNVASQRNVNPVQHLRALHPNHTHEVDPSLCLVYYLKGKQYIMRDRDFYKNKLENFAKVKFKVWRYVMYDKASGLITAWYCESAGENQHNLFDFLMFAWGHVGGRLSHGLCKYLLWDKGSANTSHAVQNMLRALGVTALEHTAGNARAKGGVEGSNNIVETQFESRLRFQPVESCEELNASVFAWANAWNANLLPGQDSRLRREGLVEPIARQDLWQLIRPEELLLLPPVDVCRAFMTAKEEFRKVRPDLSITFKHPRAERSAVYSLRGLNGVNVGDEVKVQALVFGDNVIQIAVARYDGEDLIYQVEPERGYDDFGQQLSAAVIGEEYKSMPQTAIETAAQAMDEQAYPGMNQEEVKKARAKRVTPFEGGLNAHTYLQEIELPAYLPRRGTEHELTAPVIEFPPLSHIEAAKLLKPRVENAGGEWSIDRFAWLQQRFPGGVPPEQIDVIFAELTSPAADKKTPLRIVKAA
jgi:hypothetical protein